MKYYLIVGEASGDLHASNLMSAIKTMDAQAEFRFFGGDLMKAAGGTCVKHYKEMAYMGFIPVLLHLRTIFKNMDICKRDILQWNPDVLILVDYPGFNLKIAQFIKKEANIPIYYYRRCVGQRDNPLSRAVLAQRVFLSNLDLNLNT